MGLGRACVRDSVLVGRDGLVSGTFGALSRVGALDFCGRLTKPSARSTARRYAPLAAGRRSRPATALTRCALRSLRSLQCLRRQPRADRASPFESARPARCSPHLPARARASLGALAGGSDASQRGDRALPVGGARGAGPPGPLSREGRTSDHRERVRRLGRREVAVAAGGTERGRSRRRSRREPERRKASLAVPLRARHVRKSPIFEPTRILRILVTTQAPQRAQ